MRRLRKNDTVMVIAGKDKGKSGKVLRCLPKKGRVIVQGVNYVKKHKRQHRQDEEHGIVLVESPLNASNLAVICPRCNQRARLGADTLRDGSKVRVCRKCNEVV